MSHEPATKHFSTEQLASFLDQLGQARASGELELDAGRVRAGASQAVPDPQLAPVDPRWSSTDRGTPPRAAALAEPATVLGGGHVIPIGAPRWRGHGPADGRASTRPTPEARRASAAMQSAQAGAASPSRARLREPRPLEQRSSAELLIPGLSRVRPWRVAFLIVALLSAGLLAALSLSPAPRPPASAARGSRPPPLPVPASPSPPLVLAAPGPAPHDATATSQPTHAPAREPAREPTVNSLPRAAPAHARREAVDLLLAGRTRGALDAYRGLLAAAPSPALEAVVRLLERELARCVHSAGIPCGT